MAGFLARARFVIGAWVVLLALVIALPAGAQRNSDGSVNPTASSVKEQQLLNALNPGGAISGRVSIPDQKSANLIHPAGRTWREFHEVTLRWIGGVAVLGMLALLVAFYLIRGQVKLESGFSGRRIVRFNAFERFVHWMTATCFIILALSGLNITFGKSLLLPLIGGRVRHLVAMGEVRAQLSQLPVRHRRVLHLPDLDRRQYSEQGRCRMAQARRRHRRARPSAGLSLQCRPEADLLDRGDRRHGGRHLRLPADVPVLCDRHSRECSLRETVHAIVAVLFVAAMLGHIYIGTIGMEGAFEAMGEGTVDVNWAKEHHALWLEQEMARTGPNESQRQPMATPAE